MKKVKPQKDFRLIDEDGVDAFLEHSMVSHLGSITEPLRELIDKLAKRLEDNAFSQQLNPEVPFISVGVSTFQAFLECLHQELGKEKFEESIERAGFESGWSFGGHLMENLMKENCLPRDLRTIVRIWSRYDQGARWGMLETVSAEQNLVIINWHDNFLERGRLGEKHRYCTFLRGYITGFLWESLKLWCRWRTRVLDMPELLFLEPLTVREIAEKDKCLFEVNLGREQLQAAFDQYANAREAFVSGSIVDAAICLRSALELGLREKIGLDPKYAVGFYDQMKALKSRAVRSHHHICRLAEEVYELISRKVAHGADSITEPEIIDSIRKVAWVLRGLELAEIGRDRLQSIRETLESKQ